MRKLILLTFLSLFISPLISAGDIPVEKLLCRLDSMIADEGFYTQRKINRINEIWRERKKITTMEEQYWFNRRLYDEYFVFNADSAMKFINANLSLARQMSNFDYENEWKIKKSFILSVMGLLRDADMVLTSIPIESLPESLLGEYYAQKAYLYSHVSQLSDHRDTEFGNYDELSSRYQDSTVRNIVQDNPQRLWHKASAQFDKPVGSEKIIADLKKVVDNSQLDSRLDAINAYALSRLYGDKGDGENRMRYLAISGIVDVSIANRDIASLEELADILKENGDIDRAYTYINYCRQQALKLPNRVRAASLARTEAEVHQLYIDKINTAGQRLRFSFWILALVLAIVIFLTVIVINRSHKLSVSREELRKANSVLTKNLKDLSDARVSEEASLKELKAANNHISEMIVALNEANYVKEECIGAAFALCSSYIDRLDDFRKQIARLIRSNSFKELRELVAEHSYSNVELKEFYHNFDTLFLNIYPDFVKDFNSLLRPEENIVVKPGELNTELRIYAFVRLGINDSVKIASLLHCSPQTVYNYRLRTRNKAVVPKEQFAEMVKSLGKSTLS